MKFKSVLCMILLCIGSMVFAEETQLNRQPVFKQFDSITVACPIGAVPYSYLDDDGQVKGSVIDLWRLWSEKTGIRINLAPAPWKAGIDMVCAGKADAFALNPHFEEQNSCLDDVFPIANDKAYFFCHKSILRPKTIEDLKAFKIGVIKGMPVENYFREKLPDAVLAVFPNAASMMNALKKKEILIFANTLRLALRRLKKYGLEKEFQFDPQNSLYTITAYAAVKKGNTALAEAVKQGMNLITADEQASVERKWLERASVKTEDTLVIAMSQYFPPFTFVNAEGKPAGLFVDIWKLWSEKTGQKIEFLPSTWSESIENLKNGSADIHSGLVVTPEREKWMNFSQAFYENSFYLFFPIKQGKTLSVKELSGQKVGVVQNSSQEEFLRNNYPDIELVLFKSTQEAILGAKDGEVRALANSFLSTSTDIMNLGLAGEFEAGKEALYTQTFHAGTLKENKELSALIDKGFDAISDMELAEIEKRWIPDPEKRYYKPDMKKIRLTAEEKAWIKKHPKIRVESFDGYPPGGFLNRDGVFNGINADYLSLISQRTGIKIEYVFTERGMADSMIKDGKLDIIYSFNVPKRREYLNFTKPFYHVNYMIISRTDSPFISNLNALKGKKIAVAKGMRIFDRLRKDYPEIEIYHAASPLEGLQDVSFNNADIYIGTQDSTIYLIQKHHLNNLKISGTNLYENEPYMFAIRNDWHELRGIFNKAIDSISKEEQDAISQKWLPVRFEYKADWSEIWEWAGIIGSIFIIILGISLIWNRRLAKEIHNRRMIIETATDGFWMTDAQGRLLQVNNAYCKMSGYSEQELLSMNTTDLEVVESQSEISEHIKRIMDQGWDRFETRQQCKDGSALDIEVSVKYLHDEGGFFVCFSRDITERKQSEEKLKEYSQRLEEMVEERTQELEKAQEELIKKERLAVLGHFAGSISHELRNPLAVIDSAVYLLNMKLKNADDKIQTCLKKVSNNVKKSTDIIQSLLSLSKMEKPKTKKTDVTDLVSETLRSSKIPEAVELVLDFPGESVFIDVEKEQLRMALKNIINNAVQAMDEAGKLTILIRSPQTGYIEIHIADTGNGISPEHTETIFEPLFSTKTHGIGFGLSITKMIVENHGGTIHVESDLEKGATFIITLPLVLNDAEKMR